MEVVIVENPTAVGRVVADAVERVVAAEKKPTLGLATGSSPLPVYAELIERCRIDQSGQPDRSDQLSQPDQPGQPTQLSFASSTMFLLDEYVGLAADHPCSYQTFIRQQFTDHIDIPPTAVHGLDGCATDADLLTACGNYEKLIAEHGGIDLQILGIGTDGHIGFNEPGSSFGSRTRLKTLTAQTRQDNARFFCTSETSFGTTSEAVPRHVVTQGIATILEARHIVLVANGLEKAKAIAQAVEGPVTALAPASALQFHPHTTVVVDEAAAQQLSNAAYYRDAYANKPDWQNI